MQSENEIKTQQEELEALKDAQRETGRKRKIETIVALDAAHKLDVCTEIGIQFSLTEAEAISWSSKTTRARPS